MLPRVTNLKLLERMIRKPTTREFSLAKSLSGSEFRHLCDVIAECPNITTVSCCDQKLREEGVRALVELFSSQQHVTALRMSGCVSRDLSLLLDCLANYPIVELTARNVDFSPHVQSLELLILRSRTLRILRLGVNNLPVSFFERLSDLLMATEESSTEEEREFARSSQLCNLGDECVNLLLSS